MKTNVKPGDMAWVVGARTETGRKNIGRMVEVLGPSKSGEHHGNTYSASCDASGLWFVRSVGSPLASTSTSGKTLFLAVICLHDQYLRPVTNPGDDERDESKAYLPPVPPRQRVQP